MITLSRISKRYNHQLVLNDINIKIKRGEIVGLLGPNGAGKTTTLRIIAGILPPTTGSVMIDDCDLEKNPSLKEKIGYLPENNPLYDDMTVEEFLSFCLDLKQIPKTKRKESIDFVVNHCGIAEVYFRPINELSKGYRQRVGLSQAILTKPDILILDEPTEGLDPNQRRDIASLIRELGKQRTVIISSHVLSEISKIVNRMIIIHKGEIVADDTPENLKKIGTSSQVVEMEVIGKNVLSSLRKVPGVRKVNKQKENYFVIEVEGKGDIRESLYNLAVKSKWRLFTLVAKEKAIEEVFSQLTGD